MHQTTLLQWAFLWDCLLLYLYLTSTEVWSPESQLLGLTALLSWMLMSKFVKLLGHYIRYPVDLLLLPISIIFGYLHGLIKAKAMLSLNVVSHHFNPVLLSLRPVMTHPALDDPSAACSRLMGFAQTAWGTRDGADDDDAYRMIRVSRKQQEAGYASMPEEVDSSRGEKCEHSYEFP